jgi:hypothetical protein
MRRRLATVIVLCGVAAGAAAFARPKTPLSRVTRYEYVVGVGRLSVFNIANRSLVRQFALPGVSEIRGIGASAATGMLYVSYGGFPRGIGHLLEFSLSRHTTANSSQVPGTPLSSSAPFGRRQMPAAQTRSAQRIARAGPSKVHSEPSPINFTTCDSPDHVDHRMRRQRRDRPCSRRARTRTRRRGDRRRYRWAPPAHRASRARLLAGTGIPVRQASPVSGGRTATGLTGHTSWTIPYTRTPNPSAAVSGPTTMGQLAKSQSPTGRRMSSARLPITAKITAITISGNA